MSPRPPDLAARLLTRALRADPAAPAVLGDLHEDFVRMTRARGAPAARLWYWGQAMMLAAGAALRRPGASPPGSEGSSPGRGRAIAQDAGYALRALRRAPGFTLFTASVIGLGVGAATAVFSVLEPLVLAPLPFDDPEELVWISNAAPPGSRGLSSLTSRSGNLRDFRARTRSFEGLTGYNAFSDQAAYTLTGVGEPERLVGFAVAHDFLDVLGVEPLRGRGFTAEEGLWDGPPAVVLSHGFWRRRFAADPEIVGSTITLNDSPRAVVGVLPPTFDFASIFDPGATVDFLLPHPVTDETDRHGNEMFFLGRLRDGISPEVAQADLDAVIDGLRAEQPNRWGLGARVTPLREQIAGPFESALALLVAAAATLLLIVCVNVTNLLLSRAPGRAREVAVRKALGAPRRRLARQLVLEVVLIALLGALVGTALAWAATTAVAGTAGLRIPLLDGVRLDPAALAFGIGVALLTGLLVGVVPALHVTEGGEADILREGGRGGGVSRRTQRLRDSLIVAEVTLACVLLVAGGLLVRSFRAVLDVDLGFEHEDAVAWQLNPSADFESAEEEIAFYATLTQTVETLPGIESVGLIDALPLGRNRGWVGSIGGASEEDERERFDFFPHLVDPGYFEAMRIDLIAGRNFTPDDTRASPRVLIINESAAKRLFPGEEAVGRRIWQWQPEPWEIVGVVRDVRHLSPEAESGIQIYMSTAQMSDFRTLDMVVRSQLPPEQVVATVGPALRALDPAMPTGEFWTLASTVERSVSARRFTLAILTAYGAAALLLAGLGIYGVLAQAVAERTREIGIRMALGASAPEVMRSVVGRTLLLSAAGVALGAAFSAALGRLVDSLLYGVGSGDPTTFAATALVLLAVALAASALPAVRAVRTRGLQALRTE